MRAVNHDGALLALRQQDLLGLLNVLLVKVGALATSTQDHESVLVALRPGDGGQALLSDTHEVVLGGGGTDGVNCDTEVSVGTVLEANGERQTRGKLSVQLGLGRACTDGTDRDEVGEELGGDGVQHLGGNGHPLGCEVFVHLAGDTQALVDFVAVVDIGVVDQALPADGRAGLLQVGAHDDAQVVGQLVREGLEPVGVLEGSGGVVNRAGTDNNEQAVVPSHDDLGGFVAALDNGLEGGGLHWDLGDEKGRRDEGVLALDCTGGRRPC